MNLELTVQKNAEVDLCWWMGGEAYFAAPHRLADGTWDAWLAPSHVPVSGREEPTELLTPAGVSYEMALAAIFRAMGDDMPAGFGLNYADKRITPGLPGPAQASGRRLAALQAAGPGTRGGQPVLRADRLGHAAADKRSADQVLDLVSHDRTRFIELGPSQGPEST